MPPTVDESADSSRNEFASVACRACSSPDLQPILDLGVTPLADRLLREDQLDLPEPRFPLVVMFCAQCSLVQIRDSIPPQTLFCDDYPYFSSFSDQLLQHSRRNALELAEARSLGHDSLVVEIASNDGYLLKNYQERGIPVLGVDPAKGPADAAIELGVPTRCTFFTEQFAAELAAEGRRADVIHANNVLAHVPELRGFVRGIGTLLKDRGVAVLEFPYLRDLIDHCEFDTIYHEHLCYFSVHALDRLFRAAGLHLNRLRHLDIHGGSLRIFVERFADPDGSVQSYLQAERERGLDSFEHFRGFAARVERVQSNLRRLLEERRRLGRRIAAYGAAAKGATLLNSTNIGSDLLEFVVDRNQHKVGKFMPGVKLPILPVEALIDERPDDVLLLAWNFRDEIVHQQRAYLEGGGRFLVPIPEPRVLD